MAKRMRDGECCGGCGVAGLTLDRGGLCRGCWLGTWERDETTVGTERVLDNGYEVPLPLSLARTRAETSVPVGPVEDLCSIVWGLTSEVLRGGRPIERWLF